MRPLGKQHPKSPLNITSPKATRQTALLKQMSRLFLLETYNKLKLAIYLK